MGSVVPFAVVALAREVAVNEALSGVFGSISLATWVFLLVPQLILNYKSQSAEGISLAFLTVWLIGDITNLAGAIWAGLVPTVIALGIYFCFADCVLLSQCLYYNHLNARRAGRQMSTTSAVSEDEPLLSRSRSNDSTGLPGSHQRIAGRRPSQASDLRHDPLAKIVEEDEKVTDSSWMRNLLSIVLVCVVGGVGWVIAWQGGVWTPTPENEPDTEAKSVAIGAEILGYFSAVCYLGARIPQIVKNHKDKSCDGLALLFFLLSLMGNTTYGAQILFHSVEREYVVTSLPWLIGSLGTILEDAIIFVQFRMYARQPGTGSTTE